MLKRKRLISATVGGAALAAAVMAWSAGGKNTPAVIDALQQQGLTDMEEFDTGDEQLRGYVGIVGRQPIAVYVTPDGNAIVGTRIDADGNSMDADQLVQLASGSVDEQTLAKLEQSAWVPDGDADAPRVVYTFTDANCPFCHKFWEVARPWVNAGKVQLRHVMVAVIAPDSGPKAATILTSGDPAAALKKNELSYDDGGIEAASKVPDEINKQLDANQKLMVELGFRGTPGIVYEDENGMLQTVSGVPQGDDALQAVLGPL